MFSLPSIKAHRMVNLKADGLYDFMPSFAEGPVIDIAIDCILIRKSWGIQCSDEGIGCFYNI